jgi:O-antigen ligase
MTARAITADTATVLEPAPELKIGQRAAFWAIAFISLTNLNGVAKLLGDVDRAFSGVLLVASIVTLMTPAASLWQGLGTAGGLFVLFTGLFVFIGTAVTQLAGGSPDTLDNVLLSVTALLIVVPCAQYAFIATRNGRLSSLLTAIAVICTVHVIATLTFGWWGVDAYRPGVVGIGLDLNRNSGLFWNPNEAGLALVVVTLVYMARAALGGRRWIWVVLAIASSIAVVLTFSRGSMVVLLIVLCYTILRRLRRRAELLGGVATLAIVSALLFGVQQPEFIGDTQWERVADVGRLLQSSHTRDTGDSDRGELLAAGVQQWLRSPIFGNGLGTQRLLTGEFAGVHNTIVMVFGESGVIPGLVFLAFIVAYLWRSLSIKSPVVRDFLFAFGIVVLGMCLQSHNFIENRFFNAMLGVAFGVLAGSAAKTQGLALATALRREPVRRQGGSTQIRAAF